MRQIQDKRLASPGRLPSDIDGDIPHDQYMEQLYAIEREATQSDDADATLNAIVARIQRFRNSVS